MVVETGSKQNRSIYLQSDLVLQFGYVPIFEIAYIGQKSTFLIEEKGKLQTIKNNLRGKIWTKKFFMKF